MSTVLKNVKLPDFEKLNYETVNIKIENGKIAKITSDNIDGNTVFDFKNAIISPGLIDCHCHIESSYLIPSLFGQIVSKFGTLYTVADCHEISNVAGRKGLDFFIENAKYAPGKIYFAVPSCVPATPFATSGGKLGLEDIKYFLDKKEVVALGELMNVPGVINREKHIMEMIKLAKEKGKRINGHAPKLPFDNLKKYISAGIEDDHENETYDEIAEKIELGLHIFLREGSAEHSEDKAYQIIEKYPDKIMFCTDDKTINDIIQFGHINYHLKKAVKNEINPILALKVASHNGLKYYGLYERAKIKEGNPANFVIFKNDKYFDVEAAFINGEILEEQNIKFEIQEYLTRSIKLEKIKSVPKIPEKVSHICIKANDKSLITDKIIVEKSLSEFLPEKDIVKLVNFERYGHGNKAACRITGFGIKKGAIATSLSHDCHNILALGVSDDAILKVVNKIIENNGGIALFDGNEIFFVELPVGGIVSHENTYALAKKLALIKEKSKEICTSLTDPVSTLTFMALEVIPHLKLTDKGLFDVDSFSYV